MTITAMMNEQPNRQGYSRMFTPRFGASHVPRCSFLLLVNMGHTQQPTLANGRLYLRGMDEVLCYQVHPELLGSTPDTGSAVPARRAHKPWSAVVRRPPQLPNILIRETP
jgi:hypothetical protein